MKMHRESFNYGLALLRIWMCFEVVLDHFWTHGTYTWSNPFAKYGAVAVPIFMIMSFYFTDVERVSQDNKMIRSRLGRIIMPQIFWAFTYCTVLLILHDINGQTLFPNFILQCLFGHSVNQSMWFQFDLLVMTGLAILYYKYKDKISMAFIPVIVLLALTAEYAGTNSYFFGRLPGQISFPIGRICEMIPFVVIGILLHKAAPMLARQKKHAWFICIYLSAVVVFIFVISPFLSVKHSFGYGGLHLLFVGTLTFLIFYYLPISAIPSRILHIIRFASNYTLGIYCAHRLIERMLRLTPIYRLSDGYSFMYCIVIFSMGLFLSWIIDISLGKYIKNVVC